MHRERNNQAVTSRCRENCVYCHECRATADIRASSGGSGRSVVVMRRRSGVSVMLIGHMMFMRVMRSGGALAD